MKFHYLKYPCFNAHISFTVIHTVVKRSGKSFNCKGQYRMLKITILIISLVEFVLCQTRQSLSVAQLVEGTNITCVEILQDNKALYVPNPNNPCSFYCTLGLKVTRIWHRQGKKCWQNGGNSSGVCINHECQRMDFKLYSKCLTANSSINYAKRSSNNSCKIDCFVLPKRNSFSISETDGRFCMVKENFGTCENGFCSLDDNTMESTPTTSENPQTTAQNPSSSSEVLLTITQTKTTATIVPTSATRTTVRPTIPSLLPNPILYCRQNFPGSIPVIINSCRFSCDVRNPSTREVTKHIRDQPSGTRCLNSRTRFSTCTGGPESTCREFGEREYKTI